MTLSNVRKLPLHSSLHINLFQLSLCLTVIDIMSLVYNSDEENSIVENPTKKRRPNREFEHINVFLSLDDALQCLQDWGSFSYLKKSKVSQGTKFIYR